MVQAGEIRRSDRAFSEMIKRGTSAVAAIFSASIGVLGLTRREDVPEAVLTTNTWSRARWRVCCGESADERAQESSGGGKLAHYLMDVGMIELIQLYAKSLD